MFDYHFWISSQISDIENLREAKFLSFFGHFTPFPRGCFEVGLKIVGGSFSEFYISIVKILKTLFYFNFLISFGHGTFRIVTSALRIF